jgi:hypothetical protein
MRLILGGIKIKTLILLSILIISTGCTHNIKISTKGCKASGLFSETSARYKEVKETVSVFGFSKELNLNDFLSSEKVNCKKIRYMNYTWKQGPIDSLLSVVPFYTQKTLVIEYAYE